MFHDAYIAISQNLSNGMLDGVVSTNAPSFQAAPVSVISPRVHPFRARRARRRPPCAKEARGCHGVSETHTQENTKIAVIEFITNTRRRSQPRAGAWATASA